MKMTSRLLFVVSALTALGGCVAVPAQPGYYEPAPVVYVPAPVVYGPPVYYGPSISFGFYRGGGGHGYRGGRGHGYR
jgi:hypothetical protein